MRTDESADLVLWRELLDLSGVGTFAIDAETYHCDWSPRAHELLDVDIDDPNPVASWIERVYEPDRERVLRCLENGYVSPGLTTVSYRLVTRSGEMRWLDVRARTYFWGGRPWRRMGTITDVSDRILADIRTCESITVAEFDAFTSGVAHDFRAPIRSIHTTAARVLEEFGDDLPAEARSMLTRQCLAAATLNHQFDSLQKLLRSSRSKLNPQPLEIGEIVQCEWDRLVDSLSLSSDATIRVDGPCWVQADPRLITMAVRELLKNCIQYQDPAKPLLVHFSALSPLGGGFVLTDNGVGFDQNFGEKAFEPFSRLVDGADVASNGMGLAIVRQVAERHQATVSAESCPGQGTKIKMVWPGSEVFNLP